MLKKLLFQINKLLFQINKLIYKLRIKHVYNIDTLFKIDRQHKFVHNDNSPRMCFNCGNTNFRRHNESYMDNTLCEYDYICEKCDRWVGHWAFGYWCA